MATVRLVIVLIIVGVVVLLAVQNTSPALPLVFLGGQTGSLPLSVWLLLAIALGALTTLSFAVLLGSNAGRGKRSKAYKYRPQPFYEPADTQAAAEDAAEDRTFRQPSSQSTRRSSERGQPREAGGADSRNYGSEWQDWTNLQSANQVNDWETMAQTAQSTPTSSAGGGTAGTTAGASIGSWLFGNRKAAEEEQVNRSWQELSDDWDDVEGREYRARGVSPVDENLDDINRGWDAPRHQPPPQDFEVPQSPKRVYQDGSIYSYSYRNQDSTGQRDNIYGPPDDAVYGDDDFDRQGYINLSQPEDYGEPPASGASVDYGPDGYPGQDLNEPEMAEDGVVDADYRVIIPPSPSAGEDTASDETTSGSDAWKGNDDDDDDWGEVEDALSP
jgi:uncharacterized integral membrane protein